jgi:hypothetical protein
MTVSVCAGFALSLTGTGYLLPFHPFVQRRRRMENAKRKAHKQQECSKFYQI